MSDFNIKDLSADIRKAIEGLKDQPDVQNVGVVMRVADGVAWIYGLRQCGFNEVLEIENTDGSLSSAFALNLGENEIGAVVLGSDLGIKAGAKVTLTGKSLEVPVGPEVLGRVIDPLGRPLDGKGPIKATKFNPIDNTAPGVLARKSVHEPLMTGITAIDALVPIGRGQRELIIGDRQTGKTAVALDTMINQHRQKTGVINIYVAIGQKASKVARLIDRLKREGVMEQTVVVSTSAADSASLQYLAPYAGSAIGEEIRDNGGHALIIHDDLSKHANAYRQMSLLLRRPPGREAFPGDVFYLHSRLLERSAKLSDELGGGSLTALPIIETQAGDISAYIPTNVISITDGQIFLETNLFYQGIRPAISVGTSVSRVGGSAQTKAVKAASGGLKLSLAQFRELAAFAQFSTDLDADTKHRIERGRRLTELLKQPQYSPLSIWEQTSLLLAANDGAFDVVDVGKVQAMATDLLADLKRSHGKTMDTLNEGGKPDEKTVELINKTAKSVAKGYASS